MSEPAAKQRPSIDLDEFERRLRGPSRAVRSDEDPLTELARLVGDSAPFNTSAASPHRAAIQPRSIAPRTRPLDAGAPVPSLIGAPDSSHITADGHGDIADDAQSPVFEDETYGSDDQSEFADRRLRRPRLALYLMGAALILVFGGIAATFVVRGRALGVTEPPIIMAAPGPTKVPSPTSARVDVADRDASLLNRYGVDDISSSRVVDHEEQPIDLRTLRTRSRDHGSAANDEATPAPAASFFPRPRLVHTVTVRPDGTIIADSSQPPMQSPTVDDSNPSPAPSPTADATPSAAGPAATAMPAPAAAPATPSVETGVANTPPAISAPDSRNRPADSPSDSPTDSTLASRLSPPAPVAPTRVANEPEASNAANTAPASAAFGGHYAVQLAALPSEPQAKTTLTHLETRFAFELGNRNLAVEKADSNGHTYYRVRVVGLTSDDANILCTRLKAGGGTCWVVRD